MRPSLGAVVFVMETAITGLTDIGIPSWTGDLIRNIKTVKIWQQKVQSE